MLIGLTAPAGSGKSKVARRLEKKYGFKKMHAGRPVKDAMTAFGLPKDAVDGGGKEKAQMALGGVKSRAVLEPVSKAIADNAPRATAVALRPRIMKALKAGRHVVVDGIRQPAEAALVTKMGGRLVAVDTGLHPDPNKPMDMKAAQLSPQETIRVRTADDASKKERKRALRKAVDDMMSRLMECDM